MSDNKTATRRRFFDLSGLLIAVVVFVVLIMASNLMLSGLRLDLTENRLYSCLLYTSPSPRD